MPYGMEAERLHFCLHAQSAHKFRSFYEGFPIAIIQAGQFFKTHKNMRRGFDGPFVPPSNQGLSQIRSQWQPVGLLVALELHGTAMHVTCLNCNKRYARDVIQSRIAGGDKAPRCDECKGLLKPATISFGQSMPERETQAAYEHSAACDLLESSQRESP